MTVGKLKGLVTNWCDLNLADCRRWLPKVIAMILGHGVYLNTSGLPSVEAAKELADTDVTFIDAGHDLTSVRADILAWGPKCKTLCGHDYQPNWAGVVAAVDELCPGAVNPIGEIWVRRDQEADHA